MCCTSDNHNYMCHTCAKEFLKFKLYLSSYWQNIKFSRYCPKFHIFTNIVIFQVFLQLFRPTASSLQISWQGHVMNALFHFCQLPTVNVKVWIPELSAAEGSVQVTRAVGKPLSVLWVILFGMLKMVGFSMSGGWHSKQIKISLSWVSSLLKITLKF